MMSLAAVIFESPNLWPVAVMMGCVLTVAVVWLYPSQIRGMGQTGWLVPLLRWAAVAVLVLALLKPVLLLPRSSEDVGGVTVLVDCSRSMSVVDPGRTHAEQVALAAAMGRLRPGLRPDVLAPVASPIQRAENRLQDVLSAQGDLDYARVSGRGIAEKQAALRQNVAQYAAVARELAAMNTALPIGTEFRSLVAQADQVPPDDSRDGWSRINDQLARIKAAARNLQRATDEQLYKNDAAVRAACDSLGKLSRLNLVEEALAQPGNGLLGRLEKDYPVRVLAIDRGLQPVALRQPRSPGGLKLKAEDNESDLSGAVVGAMAESNRHPVHLLVLFSDGRQVGGRRDLTSAARPSGVPVFTVDVAPAEVPDVWISDVSLSSTAAFAGETLEGQVLVRYSAMKPPAEVQVKTAPGQSVFPLAPRPPRDRRDRANELVAHVAIPVEPDKGESEQQIFFSVPVQPGEATGANNHVSRRIKVSSDRVRVTACTAVATWDFQYLRGALARRPWVDLESEILDVQHPKLGLSPGQILSAEVLVLDDVPVDALDVAQWDAVNRLVSNQGGCVILIAGTNHPLADYARQPVARGLLPFHDVRPTWKQWPGEQPAFRFVPTPLGEQEALRLTDSADGGLRRWQELPGVFRYLQIPDASLYPDVRRLLIEADSGSAVLTERSIGAGRVLFLGLDETWRWRLKASERDTDRFWRQLIRYAAGQPYAQTSGQLSLDVDYVEVRPGQPVRIRAKIGPGKSPSPVAATCTLEVLKAGKRIDVRHLARSEPGQFAGAFNDFPPGDYRLQIRGVDEANKPRIVSVPLHVVDSDEAEMRNVSGNRSVLERIAHATGGQALTIDQIDRLPERLGARRGNESRFVRHELWNSPFLFAFVLACLAGEWAMRKRFGLA